MAPSAAARPQHPENRCVLLAQRPDPVKRRYPSARIPTPRPGTQRGNSLHLAPGSAGPEGSERETPGALFLDALFCLYTLCSFSLCEKTRGGEGPSPLGCPQSYSLLAPLLSLFFSPL